MKIVVKLGGATLEDADLLPPAGAAWPINNNHKHHRSRGRRSPRRGTRR